MLYIISGNIMSFFIFIILSKSIINLNFLLFSDSLFGWFLIEHIFEDYFLTSSKFFLISDDFRSLIKNLFMIVKNVILLNQPFTFLDFILLNFCLLLGCLLKNKIILVIVNLLFLFKVCGIVNYFVIINFYVSVVFLILFLFTLTFCLVIFYWSFVLINNKKFLLFKLSICKLYIYMLLTILTITLIILKFLVLINYQENVTHEYLLSVSLLYYFLYLKLFELKLCLR